MRLTDTLENSVVLNGREYRVNLAFDKVLRAFELFRNKSIPSNVKIELCLETFVINLDDTRELDYEDCVAIVSAIFENMIFTKKELKGKDEGNHEKYYDIEQDAEYIYASFMKDYGIDLYKEQGRLHWKKFKALLGSLSKDTMFSRVVGYRAMKIPKVNKYNREEVKRLKELKELYALELSEEEQRRRIEAKFEQFSNIAKRGR